MKSYARSVYRGDPYSEPVAVGVRFSLIKPPSSKRKEPDSRPDIDNTLKAILDSLNGVLWDDDRRVTLACAHKVYGPEELIELWAGPTRDAEKIFEAMF